MNKLKIFHINTHDKMGGASQVAMDLVHHLDAVCHLAVMKKSSDDPKVIPLKNNFFDTVLLLLDKIGWKLGSQKSLRTFFSIENEWNGTYRKLWKIKEYREADIVHLHNLHGGYFDLTTLVKIAREKKIVWTLHDMWAITGGDAYTFENENYKKGIGYTPFIENYPLLNPFVDRRQHFINIKKNIYTQLSDSITLIAVSRWLENCVADAYVFNKKMKLKTLYNGFNASVFTNKNSRTWQKPRVLFFNLQNSYPFKGSWLFTEIMHKIIYPYDLYVVGEKIGTSSSVNYLNYIDDRQSLSSLYNNVDILIFPSRAESFGLTALEAMACGVCVVSSDAGGITELINDQIGYVFQNNNKDDLLVRLNLALGDLELSRKKGAAAEKIVSGKFTLENTCKQYIDLYRKILALDIEKKH